MILSALASLPLLSMPQEVEAPPLQVVTSLPYIADIARQIGGDEVSASALVPPGIDPHAVELSPGKMRDLRAADVFLENGMQLEAWAPQALEASGRAELLPGAAAHGFVTTGIAPLEVPTAADLAGGGHVHAAGNPHCWLDPLNLKRVATNVADSLSSRRPERREFFQTNRVAFERRIDEAFFGKELVGLLGGRTLDRLHRGGRLDSFLEGRQIRGEDLAPKLGGWLARARALPERRGFSYHQTWSYFAKSFEFEVVGTLEEKPGIAPGPSYLESLTQSAQAESVGLVISPPYYPRVRIEGFAERIGGRACILPTQPGEGSGGEDVFAMFDAIFTALEGE